MKKLLSMLVFLLLFLFLQLYAIPYTLFTIHAAGDLSKQYAFGNISSLAQGLGLLVNPIFSIAAIAVTIYFIMGAFKFLTSAGDKNAVASGRQMIIHAIVGFIMLMAMFLILEFIPQFFGLNGFQLIR